MELIDKMLQKGHSSYQKYHLTKMVPNINGTSQKWHLTKTISHKNGTSKLTLLVLWSTTSTLLIEPTPKITHKLTKLNFKIPWPWVWIYKKFKNSHLKITHLSPWQIYFGHFYTTCAIFARHHFPGCRICLF